MTTERLYDRLPFEVAHVLQSVERWHEHECEGRTACSASELTMLAEAAKELIEWKERQVPTDRVSLHDGAQPDRATTHLFKDRQRFNDGNRPKLRVVPKLREDD